VDTLAVGVDLALDEKQRVLQLRVARVPGEQLFPVDGRLVPQELLHRMLERGWQVQHDVEVAHA